MGPPGARREPGPWPVLPAPDPVIPIPTPPDPAPIITSAPLTFVRLLEALHADPVPDGTPAFRSLAALVSPRIFMAMPGAVTTAGFHRFTVTGSGFLGAVGVTVDGVAAGDLHVIDEVRLEVTIPDSPAAVPRVLRVIRVPEVVEGVLMI